MTDTTNSTASTVDFSNPLYLHPSDHPGMNLVSKPFDGSGFAAWKRAMMIALSAKNKSGFINNEISRPVNNHLLALWRRCNDMVISWILNTLSSDISDSVLYAETAQQLWNELNTRYGQPNGAKFYQLQKNLCEISQGNTDIATFFTKVKSNWDELNALNIIPSCTCGVAHLIGKRDEDQRLIQFLMGLNPSYDNIRSNILMMQPLPSINHAYALLIQDEKQREIHSSNTFVSESASMHVHSQSQSGKYENKKNLVCSNCKKTGHTANKCYRIIGFPKDFKFTKAKRFANMAIDESENSDIDTGVNQPGLTIEQYNDLMKLLQNTKLNQETSQNHTTAAYNATADINHNKFAGYYNGANGDVACDGYHKYKEDIQLMADMGLEAFRFSISWSRLIPNGRGPVNLKGFQYYNDFIDKLISHGIQPHITLHHDDLPQILEDEYGGWISRKAVKDFVAYADVCFREFGDRVLHWTTFNEANIFAVGGYDTGLSPPGRCSYPFGLINCTKGDSTSEPYIVAHHLLLAHASAVRLYRKKYKAMQHGFVGISVLAYWFEPYTDTTEDVKAAERAQDFYVGWFLNPLVNGDYPEIMKKNVGDRIPKFTKLEAEKVKGSFDFFGINHYSTFDVKDNSSSLEMETRDYNADIAATFILNGSLFSPSECEVTPMGLEKLLNYLKEKYRNPPIYIHENGQVQPRNGTLIDTPRVEYLHAYIGALLDALRNGSNTLGYFTWSFFDLFELLGGYEIGFGLYYVDLDDKELTRYPKLSAHWYTDFLKGKNMSDIFENMNAKETFSSPY